MKKLLLLAIILVGFIAQAQNIEYLNQANKSDFAFARKFSDEIAKSAKTKFVFFEAIETLSGQSGTIIYIPEDMTDVDKESLKAHIAYSKRVQLFDHEGSLCVHFDIVYDGANKDLEIPGTKKYVFNGVNGKFLDIFPFYQANIEPTATAENTVKGIYTVRKDAAGYWYNFTKSNTDGLWHLRNMSTRLN